MRPFFITVFCFLPVLFFGQFLPDTTKIKSDPVNDTTNQALYDAANGLTPLAKSTNYLEIRMSVFYAPNGGFEDRVIAFDGKTWSAKLIETSLDYYDTAHAVRTKIIRLIPRKDYPDIVRKLTDIGLFTLPNQIELNKPHRVFDGALYSIKYKVGNKFRALTFDNPGTYRKLYRNTDAFRKYEEIVSVFYQDFDKE